MNRVDDWDANASDGGHPPSLPAPWESGGTDAESTRARHDAFTPARKKAFLKVLAKTGCILDACRAVGVSNRTIYTHQAKDYEFARHCRLAIEMAGTEIELMAWERGVIGVEEEVICGGKLVTRLKRSDSVLRLLLQGANRKKYGPRPGFSRKRMLAHERKQIERAVREEMEFVEPPIEEVRASILRQLDAIEAHHRRYGDGGATGDEAPAGDPGDPRDSV